MKHRIGFVSNSSSSSFVLDKHHLSGFQTEKIRNHISEAKELSRISHQFDFGYINEMDAWTIEEKDNTVLLFTDMDNFDMGAFLDAILVQKEAYINRDTNGY